MLCTQGVCRNDSLKFYYCLLLWIHDFEQLLFISFVVSYEHVIEFLNLLEIIHLHEHMHLHWLVNQRDSPHDRQIGKDMTYTWYAFSVPFQEGYTSRKGWKICILESPSQEGYSNRRGEKYWRKTLIGRAQIERGDMKRIRVTNLVTRNPSVKWLKEDMHG